MNRCSTMAKVIITMLIISGGFLFLMEGTGGRVFRPKWYSTFKRNLPGGKEREQRTQIMLISALKSNGIIAANPPRSGFTEIEADDIWGTSFRIEYRRGNPVVSSAGPDKKFYTTDDRVYPY